jgi:hypothetical protein
VRNEALTNYFRGMDNNNGSDYSGNNSYRNNKELYWREIMNLKQSTEKLLQGCGTWNKRDTKLYERKTICGSGHGVNFYLCPVCKAIAKERLEMCKHFREFLEHSINPNQCGCDRCPSCRIMQSKKVIELNLIIAKLESAK